LASSLVGGLALQGILLIKNRPTLLLQKTDDRFQERSLTDPISTNQANHLSFGDGEINVAKDMALSIVNVKIAH
jgi:hypothetical protein